MKPTLLVLAAGMGSRYGGLKQIEPVGPHGELVIDYSVYDAIRAGFGRVVFVIRPDMEQLFRQTVGHKFEDKLSVDYVFQRLEISQKKLPTSARTKPWGTGHAVLAAADAIREPFAVINADDFYGARAFSLLSRHFQKSLDFAMVGFVLKQTVSEFGTVSRGICTCDGDGNLKNVTEVTGIEKNDKRFTGEEIVSMNTWGFQHSFFSALREQFNDFLRAKSGDEKAEFYLPAAVDTLIHQHRAKVKVLKTPDAWLGITYKEDKPFVVEGIRALIKAGVYPEKLDFATKPSPLSSPSKGEDER